MASYTLTVNLPGDPIDYLITAHTDAGAVILGKDQVVSGFEGTRDDAILGALAALTNGQGDVLLATTIGEVIGRAAPQCVSERKR